MAQPKARDIDHIGRDGFTVDGERFTLDQLTRTELLKLSQRFGLGVDSRSGNDVLRPEVEAEIERRTESGESIDIGGFGRRDESDADEGERSPWDGGNGGGGGSGESDADADADGNGAEGAEGDGADGADGAESESEGDEGAEGEGAEDGDEFPRDLFDAADDAAEVEAPQPADLFGDAVIEALGRRSAEVWEVLGGAPEGAPNGGPLPRRRGEPEQPQPRRYNDAEVYHEAFPAILDVLEANLRAVMLVGPAGTGKSHIAQQCAALLGLEFAALSCGQLPQDYKLEGYPEKDGWNESDFVRLFRLGGVFCLDEIDNSHPATLTVLNTALSNGFMFVNGERVDRHPEFRLVATANTFGSGATAQYVGRSPLDFATVNRFRRIEVGYDPRVERMQCDRIADRFGIADSTVEKWIAAWDTIRRNIEDRSFLVSATSRGLTEGLALIAKGWAPTKVVRSEFAEVNDSVLEAMLDGVSLKVGA